MSNAISPSVTPPSPDEWPTTYLPITGLTRAAQVTVTSVDHGLTSASNGLTFIDFTQVQGMTQINGRSGLVQRIVDDDNFVVNIDSTTFFPYTSGGFANVLTGLPPTTTQGFQVFNTPYHNTATTN